MSDLDSGDDIFGETENTSNCDEEKDSNCLNNEEIDKTDGSRKSTMQMYLRILCWLIFILLLFNLFGKIPKVEKMEIQPKQGNLSETHS